MQPVLLRAHDHTGSHESHVCNDFVGRETVAVNQVGADQTSCASETCFAVHCYAALLGANSLVCHSNKISNHAQRRAGTVIEDHVFVGDTQCTEV